MILNFVMEQWVLVAICLSSGLMLMWPTITGAATTGGSLAPAAAVQMMNREKAVVIDVSEPSEFANGHIVNSKNLPFGELQAKLEGSVKNKQNPLILVCPTGARAGRLVNTAKKLGYANTQALAGGLKAWKDAGYSLDKA